MTKEDLFTRVGCYLALGVVMVFGVWRREEDHELWDPLSCTLGTILWPFGIIINFIQWVAKKD